MADPRPLRMICWPEFMRFGLNRTEMFALQRIYGESYWMGSDGQEGGKGFCDITPQQLSDEALGFIGYRAFCRALRALEDMGLVYGNRVRSRQTLWHVTIPSKILVRTLVDDGYSEEEANEVSADMTNARRGHKISDEDLMLSNQDRANRIRKRAG